MSENFNYKNSEEESVNIKSERDNFVSRAMKFVEAKEREAFLPIEGEIEKTPLEEGFIKFSEKAIQDEIEKCGAKKEFYYDSKKIHFLPKDVFDKVMSPHSSETTKGGWQAEYGGRIALLYPSEKNYDSSFYQTIVHEMLHDAGYGEIILSKGVEDEFGGMTMKKTGFLLRNFEKQREHFYGLNELVVDKIALEIILKKKEMEQFMEGKMYGLFENVSAYGIIDRILEKLSKERNVSEEDSWRKMELTYFEGKVDTNDLRDIERIFGPQSLRVLDRIEPYVGKERGVNKKIHSYFETDDAKERDKLRKEILLVPERKLGY